jgi:uncharacterized membrane protein
LKHCDAAFHKLCILILMLFGFNYCIFILCFFFLSFLLTNIGISDYSTQDDTSDSDYGEGENENNIYILAAQE